MSELNELIASSGSHAYRAGLEHGKKLERDRILALLRELRGRAQKSKGLSTHANISAIITIIKGEK
jgi:hypothetical protein